MSVQNRLDDAELLWRHGRETGALLSIVVAIAAIAKQRDPGPGDRRRFEAFLRTSHDWTIAVEFRGRLIETDQLLYSWMRCELVHTAALPVDIRIDRTFAEPTTLAVRAGGEPEYVVLLTPEWFHFLVRVARQYVASGPGPR